MSVTDDIAQPVSAATELAIGRVVQESLANAARHSAGADVMIALFDDAGSVRVEVVSRGGVSAGAAALGGSGWGLELIRERVRAVRGDLTAGPEGDTWAVRARIPTQATT